MNLAIVVQVKNLNTVTEIYKNLLKIITNINKIKKVKNNFFLFFK
jgi:hypothetical protein